MFIIISIYVLRSSYVKSILCDSLTAENHNIFKLNSIIITMQKSGMNWGMKLMLSTKCPTFVFISY